jgi:hypothetical protein
MNQKTQENNSSEFVDNYILTLVIIFFISIPFVMNLSIHSGWYKFFLFTCLISFVLLVAALLTIVQLHAYETERDRTLIKWEDNPKP